MSSTALKVQARIRPFLKWAGGKQALAGELAGRFPAFRGRYYEPFLGGGSVFFEALPPAATVGDANSRLIETYQAIRDDWRRVAAILDALPNTKEDFMRVRGAFLSDLDEWRRAAHFIYLNKTCFRGLFRVNRRGQFNVPYGAYDRRYYDPDNLAAVSLSLGGAEFRTGDFEFALDGLSGTDFAYLDPPYYKLGGYADFNRYTAGQFRRADHVRLAALCRELDAKGIAWALSNSETPLVRHLWRGFRMRPISARREIQLNSRKRDVSELLITNYD